MFCAKSREIEKAINFEQKRPDASLMLAGPFCIENRSLSKCLTANIRRHWDGVKTDKDKINSIVRMSKCHKLNYTKASQNTNLISRWLGGGRTKFPFRQPKTADVT